MRRLLISDRHGKYNNIEKFWILWEFPKGVTETQIEQMLLEK